MSICRAWTGNKGYYGLYAGAAIVAVAVLIAAGPRLIHRIRFGR
jgi:hypothetical protein